MRCSFSTLRLEMVDKLTSDRFLVRQHRRQTPVAGVSRLITIAGTGIRCDTLLSHHPREILSPLPQHGFVHVKSLSVVPFRFDDHMHVRPAQTIPTKI
jgi:hypothetical protein